MTAKRIAAAVSLSGLAALASLAMGGLAGLCCLGQTAPNPAAPLPRAAQSAPAASAPAAPPPGPLNRTVVVLDPAHGGIDNGSRIGDSTLEKNVTLALAYKLRSLLSARALTVVMTRDSDNTVQPGPVGSPLTLDARAGIANHARGVACLSLHATGSGEGVHLYVSELAAAPGEAQVLPWLTAQAAWIPESRTLQRRMGDALTRAGIPLLLSTASVRPVDSLTCPALIVEVAPENEHPESVNDSNYQQRIADALAAALFFWRDEAKPPVRLPPAPTARPSGEGAAGPGTGDAASPTPATPGARP